VTKPELGTKRRCGSCETKFFDLNRDPILCPKCMAVFAPPQPVPERSRRPPDRQPLPAPNLTMSKVPNDLSLGGANADEETRSPTTDTEEVDRGVPLLDDQDEQLDATEIIDADIEKDDT
jgi:uncharacterized protein (TIGR02300 family)